MIPLIFSNLCTNFLYFLQCFQVNFSTLLESQKFCIYTRRRSCKHWGLQTTSHVKLSLPNKTERDKHVIYTGFVQTGLCLSILINNLVFSLFSQLLTVTMFLSAFGCCSDIICCCDISCLKHNNTFLLKHI